MGMTCRGVVHVLDLYLNGELAAAQSRTLQDHLAQCPDCRAYLVTYRQTTYIARAALTPTDDQIVAAMPEQLVNAILAARGDIA
jgi:predicted anti-sigma-YlaC factor YlaD